MGIGVGRARRKKQQDGKHNTAVLNQEAPVEFSWPPFRCLVWRVLCQCASADIVQQESYLVALAGDGVLADLVSLHHDLDAAVLVVLEDVAVHLDEGRAGGDGLGFDPA